MINFIRRLFGFTCCTEFSQWRTIEGEYSKAPDSTGEILARNDDGRYHYTQAYQERHCIVCGKIQQRKLKY